MTTSPTPAEHTALRTPLRCDPDDLGYSGTFGVYADIRDDDGHRIALVLRGTPDGKDLPFREIAAEILAAVNERAGLLERVRVLEEEREWRPINTAPKDWSNVLLYVPDDDLNEPVVEGYYSCEDGGSGCWTTAGNDTVIPTHWRPMPAPPSRAAPQTEQDAK